MGKAFLGGENFAGLYEMQLGIERVIRIS